MPPRLAASAWAGLSQVGFLADFTAALVGLVAVHLDHLLQTRKGQRGLRWDLRGGTNPPNPQCAARYLMVAVPIVRRVLQRGPILQLGLIVLAMEEVVPPFCKTTWAVWAASRESWPRPEQPPPAQISQDQCDGFIPHATPCAALEVSAIRADLLQSPCLVLTRGLQHIPGP